MARQGKPDDAEIEELSRMADALFAAMRRARSAQAVHGGGLSLAQLALLEPLAEETDLPVRVLAERAEVSVPTATRMLQQLDTKGVVVRERGATDQRQVFVRLTGHGARLLEEISAHRRAQQARSYAGFTAAERTQLLGFLRRLREQIDNESS
ncbi:MarR family winged helix-turn-helix transcriptional regulator [Sciscionella sediminilitoris]|uniref:MarR family winged helix-turn-helix transcriptional regulator n=1 Tax=Sciscionella sediminilitoris TaxID=1445613 RepID=UPI0004DF6424|nr:MarR family transcriptional regulator [Sciscionella sp. SE31]